MNIQTSTSPDASQTAWTRREFISLSVFLCLVALFRWYNLVSYDVLSADGTSYGPIGRGFFATGNFKVFGYISGPVYSFFVGLFDLALHNIELSLRLVSVFFSTLTVGSVYCMGRDFYNRQSAVAAALLCATLPFLHGMSGIDITEPTFTFFLLTGTYAFWKAYTSQQSGLAIIGGLLLAIAYLTRSEGFITWFALSSLAVIDAVMHFRQKGKQLVLRVLIPFWIAYFLLFAPYLVYLRSETGEWHLSGKASGNAQVIKAYRGKGDVDQKFMFNKAGTGFDTAQGEGLGKLLLTEPELFLANIRKNLQEFPKALNDTMPWYLLLAALAACALPPWRRTDLSVRAAVISICSPMIIYVLFFVQVRGFYPYISALCIWAGAGLALAGRLVPTPTASNILRTWLPVLMLAVPLSGYYLYQDFPRQQPPYNYEQDGGRRDDKHIGLRLKSILPPNAIVMTRSGRIGFYADRPMIIPPQATYPEIIGYAYKNNVTHLIATIQLLSMRPQLEFLYGPILHPEARYSPPPELELVHVGQETGGLPYIVYRINRPLSQETNQ